MADYRLSAQVISRSAGRSAVACAAYRSAARMVDDRTGEIHDYRQKGGLVHEEILAPDNAPDWMKDRDQLWNAVEAVERRKDAQLAREIQLSLPHELDADQRRELVKGFVQDQFVSRGMVADLAVHEPGRNGDQRNHHAHVMLTMRELAGEGFGKKNRAWNDPELLKEYRHEWANHQNREFERLGLDVRVDHRSFEDRGIDREPTQHLGPNAHEMEARGEQSRIGDENRAIQDKNSERAKDHHEAALLKLQIAAERKRFDQWADHKRNELEGIQELASLDLERRHDLQKAILEGDLEKTYGEHKATLQAEIETIDKRLESQGLRKLVRDVFGRSRSDRVSREELTDTVSSIEQRENERRTALQHRQKNDFSKEYQRQDGNQQRLETRIETARERREKDDWKPFEKHELKPANERQGDDPRSKRPDKAPETTPERDKGKSEAEPPTSAPKPSEGENSNPFRRSTSVDHEPSDYSDLHERWDRSVKLPSQEGKSNPFATGDQNPFSGSESNPFSNDNAPQSAPSPSPSGGNSSGGGSGGGGSG